MKATDLNAPMPDPSAITVCDGPPPPERLGRGLSEAATAVIAKAMSLKAGQYFYWPSPPGSWRALVKKCLAKAPVVVYTTLDKRIVVRHRDTGPMSGGAASGGAGGASAPVRSEAARLADARAARATNDLVAPVRTEVGGEAGAGGVGGGAAQAADTGSPVRLSRMAEVMLAKIKQLGEPVTMSDIRNALGVRTGHVEAVAELREAGYAEIHDRSDGRKVWKITPAGLAAHLDNIRRERA